MYLNEEIESTVYVRKSKLGMSHEYVRHKKIAVFRCDCCGEIFRRLREKISPKRLSNNYFHCCSNCDAKRFAQSKGAERKTIWDWPASSLDDISKL